MKVQTDISANIADLSQIIYVIQRLHVHVAHISITYIWLERVMVISASIVGIKRIIYARLQPHVPEALIRNTNIFNGIFLYRKNYYGS